MVYTVDLPGILLLSGSFMPAGVFCRSVCPDVVPAYFQKTIKKYGITLRNQKEDIFMGIKSSVSLYSLQYQYLQGKMDLGDIIRFTQDFSKPMSSVFS